MTPDLPGAPTGALTPGALTPGALTPGIGLSDVEDISDAVLVQAQWSGGMPYHRGASVPGTVEQLSGLLPEGARLRLDQRGGTWRAVLADVAGVLVHLRVRWGSTDIAVVGADVTTVEAVLAGLETAVRESVTLPEGVVRMRFWSSGLKEPQSSSRSVASPGWAEVSGNYAAETSAALAGLMDAPGLDGRTGRLVLWHGEPGTGKTTAVRALSREWSSWCDTHYVTDPEQLFADPRYLLEVAGANAQDEDDDDDPGRWRLVVAEDCDEYLRTDAKLRAGASLGRLLNLCDGILGHGLRVLVLLTTNEDVGSLHPAITRPGRCLSAVEFARLSRERAQRWLGADVPALAGAVTLAELYALREERAMVAARPVREVGGYL